MWSYNIQSDYWEKMLNEGAPYGSYANFGTYFDEQKNELQIIHGKINANPAFPSEMLYWKYSFVTNNWEQLDAVNDPPGASIIGLAFHPILRKAILFGGIVKYEPKTLLEGTWVLDVDKMEWSEY